MGMSPGEARKRAIALLDEVGIPDPEFKINAYPSQMSGGQQQRVMIAMAIACEPKRLAIWMARPVLWLSRVSSRLSASESSRSRRPSGRALRTP